MSRFGSYSSDLWRQKQILMEQDTLFRPRQERIRQLLTQLAAGIYERDYVLAMAFLSAIAGESIFLLGLPGVGKSLIARRLKLAFRNAQSFEYLMSRFSTPDEIFGPVSISKLKNEDTYERLVEGYLPTADVVFLDEIFACKIDSQAQQEETGRIDWRQGYEYGLRQEAYALPDSVASQCVAFLRRMGLNFGCFDFIVPPSGEYVFLECNPNGQWLWIELAVGLKISEAIADFLQNPSSKQTPVRS